MRNIVPIKIYEYLAMHKPVITTKLPGVMKEFGENNGVIYVDRPEDVIDTVLKLNDDDILKNSLRAEKFIQRYNWNIIIPEFESLLSHIQRRS
jgi:glycosyltransferase involved in cell wall biosynthesis